MINNIKMNDINRNNLVVQHNALIESAYELTTLEKKIILCAISTINNNTDEDFDIVEFNVAEIAKSLNTSSKNIYMEIKKAIESLENREVKDLKNYKINTKWVASSKYYESEGRIEIGFSPHMKPYLLQLGRQVKDVSEGKKSVEEIKPFTSYNLKNGLILKSFNSIRMYEICKQYEKLKIRVLEIDMIKKILQIEGKYPNFNHFDTYVLKKTVKDINENTDLIIDYNPIKSGRKMKYIEFYISSKKTYQDEIMTKPEDILRDEAMKNDKEYSAMEIQIQSILSIIPEINYNEAKSIHVVAKGNIGKIAEKYYMVKGKSIGNLVGYLIKAIEKDYKEESIQQNSQNPYANRFHNFEQRTSNYTADELEKLVLENQKYRIEE